MKKYFLLALSLVLIFSLISAPAFAAGKLLDDGADLLSAREAEMAEDILEEISLRQDMDVVVVTVDSTQGKSPMDYADDYYDYGGYSGNGILLLVSMEERDWWISTTGYGITAFTDAGLDYISDRVVPYMSEGDFYTAFVTFAELCDEFISQAKAGNAYDLGNLPKEPFAIGLNLFIAIAIGAAVSFLVTRKMQSKLKSVTYNSRADGYAVAGSRQLSNSHDMFVYSFVNKTSREEVDGGSSTHRSSSGTIHGGRGGKF